VPDVLSESLLRDVVDVLVRCVETAGALVIFAGAALAFVRFVGEVVTRRQNGEFVRVRLGLGRYLALGLEFQLAADILKTAIAPTFAEIGQLAAVAAIRTALNFFLAREIAEERRQLDGPADADGAGAAWS
jgi:uncharacterized membrane protein